MSLGLPGLVSDSHSLLAQRGLPLCSAPTYLRNPDLILQRASGPLLEEIATNTSSLSAHRPQSQTKSFGKWKMDLEM